MKNRFNNIDSKEWLPFQKSWFRYKTDEELYRKSIRFFMKFDSEEMNRNFFFLGSNDQEKLAQNISIEEAAQLQSTSKVVKLDNIQFALLDLRELIKEIRNIESWNHFKRSILELCFLLKDKLYHRRFLSILIPNVATEDQYFPFAWDFAKTLGLTFSLKDEKIACSTSSANNEKEMNQNGDQIFYQLFFRNDEKSANSKKQEEFRFGILEKQSSNNKEKKIARWFILKPKSRKRKEILHPAKFPEDLANIYLDNFTRKNDVVFDPMCGTGTTLVSAIDKHRNAYGVELSTFFASIARERCFRIYNTENNLFEKPQKRSTQFEILIKDIRDLNKADIPQIDYIFTSPPYWDMLNMKGAENQAKRIKKGLQINYTDPESELGKRDLGNIENYETFLNELEKIYFHLYNFLQPGAVLTIVVKNIKKQGVNYPFAWDLAERLMKKLILLPENFWLQDDISIAPYGYGNTFVSNTFHQYCLSFQKPKKP
jgi:DNA modification methylase